MTECLLERNVPLPKDSGKRVKWGTAEKDWFEKEYQFLMRQYEADHGDPFVNFLMGGVLVNLQREELAARHYRLFIRKAHDEKKFRPYVEKAKTLIEELEETSR